MDDTLFFLKSGQNLQNFGMNLTHMFFFLFWFWILLNLDELDKFIELHMDNGLDCAPQIK